MTEPAPLTSPASPTHTPAWWLALYPHVSSAAKQRIVAAWLAGSLLAGSVAAFAHGGAPTHARPAASRATVPDARPAVQAALRNLGLAEREDWAPGFPPAGGEFQINTYTTGHQTIPAVALDADGDFVVVWQSAGSGGTDTSDLSIHGQRYNSVGTAQGGEFQINTYTTGSQNGPAVALDADGDFVVVWMSAGSSGTDTSADSIHGQRYNSLGTAQGGEFQINTYTTDTQRSPAVALDADGDFVVVWTSNGSSGTDTSLYSIQGQRYNSVGTAQGGEFQINTYTTRLQGYPAVALDAAGDFVVVWESWALLGTDTSYSSIHGQRYNSVGTAQGGEFQINTYITSYQWYPDVALDASGDFVVVWMSDGSSGTDTSYSSIHGQRYNSVGTAQGGEFQINTYTTDRQRFPAVALDADGDFVVVWESNGSSGDDTFVYSVQGQRYNSVGTAQGGEFQINTYTTRAQVVSDVALDADGDFVVVWESNGSSGTDTLPGYSIHGQRYTGDFSTPSGFPVYLPLTVYNAP